MFLKHKSKLNIFKTSAALGICIATVSAGVITGPITNPSNNHVYYMLSQNTWSASESDAISIGGHLIAISDSVEDAWVYSTFSQFGGVSRNLWIGLTSGNSDGTVLNNYFWSDGDTTAYRNFAPSEPNFATEHYVYMMAPGISVSGKWNNWSDSNTAVYTGFSESLPSQPLFGVVEVVPEPSTILLLCLASACFILHRSWKNFPKLGSIRK